MLVHTQFLGRVDYAATLAAMKLFTQQRTATDAPVCSDQLWLCEHPPVFTQGIAGLALHILQPGDIPVVATDRGGQATYHGPGQVVAYPLLNLKNLGYFVKEYVFKLEESILKTLLHFGVTGHRVSGAPGIYVRPADPYGHQPVTQKSPDFQGLAKIAALGIKVTRHCTYHGLALNVDMDLAPFSCINPCGYSRLQTIDLASLGLSVTTSEVAPVLAAKLSSYLTP
jgi:lipoyl(octanoyl) transferase